MDYEAVLSAIAFWPVDDRIRLVHDVWDRLVDEGHDPELTDAIKAELDRRIAELDRDPDSGIPWDVVKARVLGRLRQ
jgi:putative addiction module component (TIGR02574 family)